MNWKLFVAQRIYRSREGARQVSRPAVLIATWGIAVGLAVMIVAVAVVVGFKHEVRDKVVGLGAASVKVPRRDLPKGSPIAATLSPTFKEAESPKVAAIRFSA